MAEFAFSEDDEEDHSVVRIFRNEGPEDSGSASPSASDEGDLIISEYERKKTTKAKLRTLSSKSVGAIQILPQRSKDEEIEASLNQLKGQGKYIKLNVGGSLFYTTLGTLTKHDNMLRAMFSERIPLETDGEGIYSNSDDGSTRSHVMDMQVGFLLTEVGSISESYSTTCEIVLYRSQRQRKSVKSYSQKQSRKNMHQFHFSTVFLLFCIGIS